MSDDAPITQRTEMLRTAERNGNGNGGTGGDPTDAFIGRLVESAAASHKESAAARKEAVAAKNAINRIGNTVWRELAALRGSVDKGIEGQGKLMAEVSNISRRLDTVERMAEDAADLAGATGRHQLASINREADLEVERKKTDQIKTRERAKTIALVLAGALALAQALQPLLSAVFK